MHGLRSVFPPPPAFNNWGERERPHTSPYNGCSRTSVRPTIHRNCFHAIRFNGISKFRRLHIERHDVARQSNAAGEYIVGLKDCSEPKGVVLATVQYMCTYVHVCNITLCLFRSSFHTQIIGKHYTETFSESVEIANFIVTI